VGHPYIASLWLGSLSLKRSRLKWVLRRSLALFCLLPIYFQASENRLTKGSKGPFVILHAHSRVWMGSMLYKAFCLVYHGSCPNNCEHILHSNQGTLKLLLLTEGRCYISKNLVWTFVVEYFHHAFESYLIEYRMSINQ